MIRIFLIPIICLAVTLPALSGDQETATQKKTIGFVDRDGDGLNDLAPDCDRDGIPDGIDSDIRGGRWQGRKQWAMFRTMPDSAGTDSLRFRNWWQQSGHPPPWTDAWRRWRNMNERRHPGGGPFWHPGNPTPYDPRFHPRRPRPEPGGPGHGGGG